MKVVFAIAFAAMFTLMLTSTVGTAFARSHHRKPHFHRARIHYYVVSGRKARVFYSKHRKVDAMKIVATGKPGVFRPHANISVAIPIDGKTWTIRRVVKDKTASTSGEPVIDVCFTKEWISKHPQEFAKFKKYANGRFLKVYTP